MLFVCYVLLSLSRRKLKQKRDKKMRMKSAANAKREHSARLTYSIEYLAIQTICPFPLCPLANLLIAIILLFVDA